PRTEPQHASSGTPRRFGAGKAFITFLGFNLAQLFVGVGFVVAFVTIAVVRGANVHDPATSRQLVTQVSVLLLLVSPVHAIGVTLFFARLWAWDVTKDRSPSGLGLATVRSREVVIAGMAGIVSGVAYLLFTHFVLPPRLGTPLGPLAAIAATSSFARGAWSF